MTKHCPASDDRIGRCVGVARAAGVLVLTLATAGPVAAQITREDALALAYPGATVRAERVFLTAAEQREAASRAGVEIPTALVARYVATAGGAIVGRAYVDTHVVRTKRESLLVALDADGRVKRVEVTAFLEPAEYTPPEPWRRQYEGRALTDEVAVNRAIRPIAGATLTARAVNDAVRRVLAIDAVTRSSETR